MEIYTLLSHLRQCPEEFLQALFPGENLPAIILLKDTYRKIYGSYNIQDSELPEMSTPANSNGNKLFSIQVACWFFSYHAFENRKEILPGVHRFIFDDLMKRSEYVKFRSWMEDDDRAEEFIRLALYRCGIVPDGETPEIASDRLDSLDTLKRLKVLKESNEAFKRIKEIRRKMEEKKAREAANVYGRE